MNKDGVKNTDLPLQARRSLGKRTHRMKDKGCQTSNEFMADYVLEMGEEFAEFMWKKAMARRVRQKVKHEPVVEDLEATVTTAGEGSTFDESQKLKCFTDKKVDFQIKEEPQVEAEDEVAELRV